MEAGEVEVCAENLRSEGSRDMPDDIDWRMAGRLLDCMADEM